ncbi:MAG: hypothetical protein WBO34_07535 [Gammaproteobacteria bacterium]
MTLQKTLLVCFLLLITACSELQPLPDNVTDTGNNGTALVIDGKRGVHSWLADFHSLRTQPAESLAAVLDAREAAFRAKPTIENRMRLVMLLLVDTESVRDDRRARLLLNRLDPLPAGPDDREFIVLLRQFLDGRQDDAQKLSVLWKQVTQQNRRIDELEQQLKALTNIEQNIQQREPPPVTTDVK